MPRFAVFPLVLLAVLAAASDPQLRGGAPAESPRNSFYRRHLEVLEKGILQDNDEVSYSFEDTCKIFEGTIAIKNCVVSGMDPWADSSSYEFAPPDFSKPVKTSSEKCVIPPKGDEACMTFTCTDASDEQNPDKWNCDMSVEQGNAKLHLEGGLDANGGFCTVVELNGESCGGCSIEEDSDIPKFDCSSVGDGPTWSDLNEMFVETEENGEYEENEESEE